MKILRHLLSVLCLVAAAIAAAEQGRFLGARETEYPEWFKQSFLDLREDLQEATNAGRRLVLFFYQDGCPYCHLLVNRNLSQRSIRERLQKDFDVIALNLFGDRRVTDLRGRGLTEKAFGEALRVQFTPTLLFFDEQGRVILRLNGYLPPQRFERALEYVAGHHEKTATFRAYLARHRTAAPRGELQSEPFFMRPPYDLSRRTPGRPLAVFFEQRQCPDCDRLHRELLPDPEIRALLEHYDAVQLDLWAKTPLITPDGRRTTAARWARDLGVVFAPTFILFDPDGREIIRSEAMFKRFHTASLFAYGLDGAYRRQPNFQRFLSDRAHRIREQGRDVDIWR